MKAHLQLWRINQQHFCQALLGESPAHDLRSSPGFPPVLLHTHTHTTDDPISSKSSVQGETKPRVLAEWFLPLVVRVLFKPTDREELIGLHGMVVSGL